MKAKKIFCFLLPLMIFFHGSVYPGNISDSESLNYKWFPVGQSDEKNRMFLVSADPTGFLLYGPSINFEITTGNVGAASLGFRIIQWGLLERALNENFESGWSINCGYKFFITSKRKLSCFFIGPGLEIGQMKYDYGYDMFDKQYVSYYDFIFVGCEFGYRWVWRNGISLAISDYAGLAIAKSSRLEVVSFDWFFDRIIPSLPSIKIGYAF